MMLKRVAYTDVLVDLVKLGLSGIILVSNTVNQLVSAFVLIKTEVTLKPCFDLIAKGFSCSEVKC